ESAETSARVRDQVKPSQPQPAGEAVDAVKLEVDRVAGRRSVFAIKLEAFQVKGGALPARGAEGAVSLRRRSHTSWNADDLGLHTGAFLLICSIACSTRFGSRPAHRITSSLVSKLG